MLKKEVLETIKKHNLIEKRDKIVVGVSGGPDSICLINILNDLKEELGISLVVCHVNHMIREEAEEDEKFVKDYCKRKEIPFEAKKINIKEVANKRKNGTEEAGREERYKFFTETLKKYQANKIATAHTKGDNAETILMNLIRGTGSSGLKGIKPKRDNIYIKPLIEIEREKIEEYCKQNNLNPRHDKTNDENIYTRNKIRNILIPLLKKDYNPNIIETLTRLSNIITIENDYLDKKTEQEIEKILIKQEKEEIILNLKEFNKKHEAIRTRIILQTIKKLLGTADGISNIHIQDIIKLCEKNIGNKYLTPNKNIKIAVNRGKMYFFVIKKT